LYQSCYVDFWHLTWWWQGCPLCEIPSTFLETSW
jgi:hypothetical protein